MDMEEENENPGVVQELPFTKFFAFYNSISEITDIGNKAAGLISEVGDVDSCDRLDALLQRFANFDRELDKDRRAIDLSIQQANADNENSHPMLVNYFKSIRKDVQVPNPGLNQKHIEAIQKKVEEIRNEKLESANGNAANGAGEGEEPEMVELLGRVILEEKDPITKKRIEQPVKNSICGHIYDQQSVASFIEECRQRRQLCQCPVQMCKNRTQLKMQQMVPFPQFFDMIRRSTGPSTSG